MIDDWPSFWVGVIALPVLTLALWVCSRGWWAMIRWLKTRWGISFEFKTSRNPDNIPDFRLRGGVFWERAYGFVFTGHWYRERFDASPSRPKLNRWVGIGRTSGPALMVFRTRTLMSPFGNGESDD